MGIAGRSVAMAGIILILVGFFLPIMCDSDAGCDDSINLLNDPTFILDNEDSETRLTFNEYLISNAYGLMILFLLGCTVIATIIGDRMGMLVAVLSISVGLLATYGLIDRLANAFEDEAYPGYGWFAFFTGCLLLFISIFLPRNLLREQAPVSPAYGTVSPPPEYIPLQQSSATPQDDVPLREQPDANHDDAPSSQVEKDEF